MPAKRDGPFARKEAGLTQTAAEEMRGKCFLIDEGGSDGGGDGGMHAFPCHRKKGLATTATTEYKYSSDYQAVAKLSEQQEK